MQSVSEKNISDRLNRPQSALSPRPERRREAKRKLVDRVFCPRCQSDAIYRYGKTANGKKRYLCQVCRRQFIFKRLSHLEALERPTCPSCGKPMHVYMRQGDWIRFRCADYPDCRTFFKRKREANLSHARLLSLRARPDESQDPDVETPADPREGS